MEKVWRGKWLRLGGSEEGGRLGLTKVRSQEGHGKTRSQEGHGGEELAGGEQRQNFSGQGLRDEAGTTRSGIRELNTVGECYQPRVDANIAKGTTKGKQEGEQVGKEREGHSSPGCPYWADRDMNMNEEEVQNEMSEYEPTSPMVRGKGKEEHIGVRPECHGEQELLSTQRNGNGSSAGLKAKRLARAGMGKGDADSKEFNGGCSPTRRMPQSYAEILKGDSEDEGKEDQPDRGSDVEEENLVNATLEGEVVRCEFEEEHYEGVVNCFKDSTILVHFLGRPPNEVELRRWLQEIWSGKGWYIDRVRYLGKGYYAVVFDENVRVRDVLKEGPWYFRGGLVLVQPWEPDFSVDHGSYGRHPAWVELCNLPVHLWQFARNFFETIGTVISFEERQTFTFRPHARACVLIDTNKELPKKLEIKTGGRVMYEIKILVLGLPNACFRCKQSGHFIRNCPYKVAGEKKGGDSNEERKAQKEPSKGRETEVVVDMEGIEDAGTYEREVSIKRKKEDGQLKEPCSAEGGVEEREEGTKEVQKKISGDRERGKGKGIEKENIPPANKNEDSPKGKERLRKGKDHERAREEEVSGALIPYSSPPPPTIGDFLMEALDAREDEQEHGFQVVRRKSKRFPLANGTREETRSKGKVQRLCIEWDAKNSR